MVGLDPAFGFDPVRVNRALDQVVGCNFSCFFLKHPDESLTYGFSFLFRVCNSGQGCEKPVLCIHDVQVHVGENVSYSLGFSFPHEPGINIDRLQPVPNCPVSQLRTNRTVHASGKCNNCIPVFYLLADFLNCLWNEFFGFYH